MNGPLRECAVTLAGCHRSPDTGVVACHDGSAWDCRVVISEPGDAVPDRIRRGLKLEITLWRCGIMELRDEEIGALLAALGGREDVEALPARVVAGHSGGEASGATEQKRPSRGVGPTVLSLAGPRHDRCQKEVVSRCCSRITGSGQRLPLASQVGTQPMAMPDNGRMQTGDDSALNGGSEMRRVTRTLVRRIVLMWMLCFPGMALMAQSITVVSFGGSYARASQEAYHRPFTEETGIEVRLED